MDLARPQHSFNPAVEWCVQNMVGNDFKSVENFQLNLDIELKLSF